MAILLSTSSFTTEARVDALPAAVLADPTVEAVRPSAPRPLAGYAHETAKAARRDLLDRIKQRAESGARGTMS